MDRQSHEHEVLAEERRILDDTAHALGLVVMEFARLEFNLGMRIAALRPGLETKAGETWFAQRIGILEDAARRRFDTEPVAFASHLAWIAEATALRAQRNQLVHGRWAIDPHRGMARNLVGVPFGTQTASRDYTPDDLLAFRDRILAASKALDLLPPV